MFCLLNTTFIETPVAQSVFVISLPGLESERDGKLLPLRAVLGMENQILSHPIAAYYATLQPPTDLPISSNLVHHISGHEHTLVSAVQKRLHEHVRVRTRSLVGESRGELGEARVRVVF